MTYAKLLGLAHPRHIALVIVGAAFQLDGGLFLLHLLDICVVFGLDLWDKRHDCCAMAVDSSDIVYTSRRESRSTGGKKQSTDRSQWQLIYHKVRSKPLSPQQ